MTGFAARFRIPIIPNRKPNARFLKFYLNWGTHKRVGELEKTGSADLNAKKYRGRVERPVSAGGVVYRQRAGRVEVALCGRREPPRWSLPKGTPDQGETIEQTALREVREETGLKVALEEPIGSIQYWFKQPPGPTRFNKTVYFYLMSCHGGSVDDHDYEFDEVEWVPIEEARRKLTYANEVGILGSALDLIQKRYIEG